MSYGVYGGYMGGDPRRFTPDEECCTTAEIAAWRDACAAWDQGLRPEPDGHVRVYDATGKLVLHIARNPFGIGVTMMDGDDPEDGDEDDDGPQDDEPEDDDGPDDPAEAVDDSEAEVGDALTVVPAGWLTADLDAVGAP